MSLIIEDGSLPAGADSYVTVAEVRAFADARALTGVPVADDDVEPHCRLSSDYVNGIEYKFQGLRVSADQVLTWPRSPVTVHGFEVDNDEIPQQLKDGCCQLAIDSANGTNLQPSIAGKVTTKEKVGTLEVTFSEKSTADGTVDFAIVDSLFNPLFASQFQSSGGNRFIRI